MSQYYAQLSCNQKDHQIHFISAICRRGECDQQSALCQKCQIVFHQYCLNQIILLEDLPKQLDKIQNDSENIVNIIEALIQQLKKLQKQYQNNIKTVHEYQGLPNMANLNKVGQILRTPQGNLEDMFTGSELISQFIVNYLSPIKSKGLTEKQKKDFEDWEDKGIQSISIEGDSFYKNQEWDKAIQCYDRCLCINPLSIYCLNQKGLALSSLDKIQEAIQCFDQILKISPNESVISSNKGLQLQKLGKYEEAILCFDKELIINPNNYLALCNKGETLNSLNRFEEAIQSLNLSINIKPYENTYYYKSISLENLNQLKEAEICLIKALEIQKDNKIIQNRLKLIQEKLKQ